MNDQQAKEFLPIRVSTLRGDLKIPFNAYVQVAGKHIMYCREGDSFEGYRLNRLRDKKIKKLFIALEQESLYRQYVQTSIDLAYDVKSRVPLETRAEVVQGQQIAVTEQIMESPEDQESYQEGKELSLRFSEFLTKEPSATKFILNLPNVDSNLAHHGVNVATLAVGMYHQLKLEDSVPLEILSLGCFLHDLEHFYTASPFEKSEKDMSPEEKKIYRQHPIKGAERVKDLKHFDEAVIRIIYEHEELIDGSGFPQGIKESGMGPSVLIASTANSFDRYLNFQKIKPKEALKTMLIDRIGLHPLAYVKALQESLKGSQFI